MIGRLGEPENIVSSLHLLNDCSLLAVGTRRGNLSVYESKNLLEHDSKLTNKALDKKEVKHVRMSRRMN